MLDLHRFNYQIWTFAKKWLQISYGSGLGRGICPPRWTVTAANLSTMVDKPAESDEWNWVRFAKQCWLAKRDCLGLEWGHGGEIRTFTGRTGELCFYK